MPAGFHDVRHHKLKPHILQTMTTMKRDPESDSRHNTQVHTELPCWSSHLQSSLDGTGEAGTASEPKLVTA